MRIEIPVPTWADTMQRAEDDAHTLTVAPAPVPGPDWTAWQWAKDPVPTLRTQVEPLPARTVTITL
jgi:hypothetical protein